MVFDKISSPSLKDMFIQRVEDGILSGELEIGSKLPSERDLVEQMQISRNVISIGIAELERIGFLEIRPRQGVFIADYRKTGTMDTLVSIMRHNGGTLRKEDIRSMLEFRIFIETLTTRLAIERASDEELTTLEPYLEILRSTKINKVAAQASFDFHHQMSIIGQNTLCPLIYYSFRPAMLGLWERYCRLYGIKSLCQNKEAYYIALLERDIPKISGLIEQIVNDSISGKNPLYSD